jgi:hypothetical protein
MQRGARVAVSVTWRPADGARQSARLTTRVRR